MKLFFFYLFIGCFLLQNCSQSKKNPVSPVEGTDEFYTAEDFYTIKKIDAHIHLYTSKLDYAKQAAEDNFSLITINLDDVNEPPPMEVQQQFALQQIKAFPKRVAYATTISVRNFNTSTWQQQTIAWLKNSFAKGAIAVKIYKVIGMSLRDKNGKLVMIDDPWFDTVFNFIIQNKIPVLGHLGEPKNCWLPLEKMTIKGAGIIIRSNRNTTCTYIQSSPLMKRKLLQETTFLKNTRTCNL